MALIRFVEIWYRITPAPLSFYLVWGIDDGTAMIVDINGLVQLAHPPGYNEARDWLVQKDFLLIDSVIKPTHPAFAVLVAALPTPVTKDGQSVMEPVRRLEFCVYEEWGCARHISLVRAFKSGNVDAIALNRHGQDWPKTNELFQCYCSFFDPMRQTHWEHLWDIMSVEGCRLCYGRLELDPDDQVDVDELLADILDPDY